MEIGKAPGWLRVTFWAVALAGGSVAFLIADSSSVGGAWARYWPWLIVAWLILFQLPSLHKSRGLSVQTIEVWWIVVVIMVGTLWTGVTHLTPQAVPLAVRLASDMDLFDLLGENYDFDDHFEWVIPAGAGLQLRNSYGSVHVTPSDDGRTYLDVRTSVRATGGEAAAALAGELAFQIEEGDSFYVVRSNHSDMPPPLARRFRTRLEVRVPPATPVAVENSRGTVRLDGFSGPQEIYTRDGGILARPSGGTIEANAVRGDVVVLFAGVPRGSISLSADQGDVRLELPSGSGFEVEGDVWSGSFVSDFPEVRSSEFISGGTSTPGDQDRLRIDGRVGPPSAEVYFQVRDGGMALIESGSWPWGSFR